MSKDIKKILVRIKPQVTLLNNHSNVYAKYKPWLQGGLLLAGVIDFQA